MYCMVHLYTHENLDPVITMWYCWVPSLDEDVLTGVALQDQHFIPVMRMCCYRMLTLTCP